ncbi:hypothetical protein NDU88_004228 [Pleurodeles waltl]|uniref:Uncharacterized protein n=1 Tax=Pleurodeles waltl TaxID=8319 RepID=A0AAV7NKH0_PLEWA|nr:hypothetical protein NDU88_004228 [Pleurodeles waltl]
MRRGPRDPDGRGVRGASNPGQRLRGRGHRSSNRKSGPTMAGRPAPPGPPRRSPDSAFLARRPLPASAPQRHCPASNFRRSQRRIPRAGAPGEPAYDWYLRSLNPEPCRGPQLSCCR